MEPVSNTVFGVVAPDSGNQTILIKYGSEEQKKRWLEPSIAGEIRSCYSMTEPDQPGSDPYSIQTRATRDGDEWVISGRKWFTSGAHRAAFAIVMCRTEEDDGSGGVRDKMTQIIVPTDTPGFNILRSVPVWGHDGDHCKIDYDNVRVPVTNQLGATGSGHQAAQDRLGAGRVFHCMNSIGQMWRAFGLMMKRVITRQVHGGPMYDKQFMQGFIADSYIDIQSARLMTIHAPSASTPVSTRGPTSPRSRSPFPRPSSASRTGRSRSTERRACRATPRSKACTAAPAPCAFSTVRTRSTAS